ncbi:hypothetical protein J6590_055823 [Homalodisca vitripennis]|nr:hypothetical protein J6590_055823 [Homalodisca vitripennis]
MYEEIRGSSQHVGETTESQIFARYLVTYFMYEEIRGSSQHVGETTESQIFARYLVTYFMYEEIRGSSQHVGETTESQIFARYLVTYFMYEEIRGSSQHVGKTTESQIIARYLVTYFMYEEIRGSSQHVDNALPPTEPSTSKPVSPGCALPPGPTTRKYCPFRCKDCSSLPNGNCSYLPGAIVNDVALKVQCQQGYGLPDNPEYIAIVCLDGSWFPQIPDCQSMYK